MTTVLEQLWGERAAREKKKAGDKPKLHNHRFGDRDDAQPRAALVKGLLLRSSFALVFGPPKQGKSTVLLDIAYHVASGKDWRDLKVKGGPVVYLAYEGYSSLPDREAAILKHHGGSGEMPFVISEARHDLSQPDGRKATLDFIKELTRVTFQGQAPVLIIIDTVAKVLSKFAKGGDENSAADMSVLCDALEALAAETGACVVAVHHTGKDKKKGARGSNALLGAVDTAISVDDRTITVEDQRDLPSGLSWGFNLHPVHVRDDDDGDAVAACVALPDGARRATKRERLSGQPKKALDALIAVGEPAADGAWREAFEAKAWPVDPPAIKVRTQAWRRVVEALVEGGHIEKGAGGWRRRALA